MSDLYERLRRRAAREPATPFVTWYGAGGARAELSAVTFSTAVAKTAGLLVDDIETEPGDGIRLELPLHWQLPVWLAASDLAGLAVDWRFGRGADVAVTVVPDPALAPRGPGTVVVSSPTAFGAPVAPVPPPLVDHFTAALGQPDVFTGAPGSGSWQVGADVWDPARIEVEARVLAAAVGLGEGGRVLVGPDTDLLRAGLAGWAAPLVLGASSVLVGAGDPEGIATTERASAQL